jgi:diguanylate cyclase (GGDEF)-like protein
MAKEKLTVLIVEDQLVNREILKTILAADYDVLEAENGKEAFAVLRKGQPISAILTDIVMPVMDGYTLLNELGKSPFSSIPTIAITGEKDPDSEQKCLDLGAWDFVTKPYQPLTLLTRLKNVIVRSQFYLLSEMKTIYEHDPVTGLDNRSYFFKRTRELLADHPDKTFALVRFDVDHFQTYNSFWGEKEGDLLLQFIANEVRKVSEDYSPSTSSRINADVFCLCVPFDPISLNDTVEKERQIFADYRKDFRLSLTVGVYVISDPTEDVQKMYEYATLAAKEGKKQSSLPAYLLSERDERVPF